MATELGKHGKLPVVVVWSELVLSKVRYWQDILTAVQDVPHTEPPAVCSLHPPGLVILVRTSALGSTCPAVR